MVPILNLTFTTNHATEFFEQATELVMVNHSVQQLSQERITGIVDLLEYTNTNMESIIRTFECDNPTGNWVMGLCPDCIRATQYRVCNTTRTAPILRINSQ